MSFASPSDQVDGFTVFARQLLLLSLFLRLGGPLFKLAIKLFDDITQNGDAGGEQPPISSAFTAASKTGIGGKRCVRFLRWRGRPRRQGHWIRIFLVALGAYIAAGLLESVADAVLLKSVNPQSLLHSILSLIIGPATIAAAGYVIARFRPGAETVMGGIVFVAVTVLLSARAGEVPLWYGFAFLIAGPLASLAGEALFSRSKT